MAFAPALTACSNDKSVFSGYFAENPRWPTTWHSEKGEW
jgi:hypothetical protein